MNKNILWTILLSTILICASQPSYGSILIGRITHMEGTVLTLSEDEEDWMEIGSNTPVGAEDGFYTEEGSKAELVFPNGTMLRIGELTEVEILSIEEEATEIYIRTGIVRAYSRGPDTVMKVGTAMGYVEIPPQGITDFYVDDRSTEVVPIQEDILFHKTVGPGAPETHQLRAGSYSLIFSVRHVETGTVLADTSWNRWCLDRDMVLKEQAAIVSSHLPSSLQVYSYELEPYGEWERIKYRGYYYWFWRPVHMSIGWSPFTSGYWNRWHREYVWISTETWGWCTYHYGNWVNLSGVWWWTPYIHMGVSLPGISLIDLRIHFGPLFRPSWHPGRVAWISTTSHVGWIPLAPWETYYGCRNWGPRTVVVKYRDRPRSGNHRDHYAYREHSVIIPQKEFRRVRPNRPPNYRKLMVTGIEKKTLLSDSKPTYGHHKMVEVKQDVPKGTRNDRTGRQGTITKSEKTFRSSTPSMRASGERALLTQEKNMNSGGQDQVRTAPMPRTPLTEHEYATRQDLKQTESEQRSTHSPILQHTQDMEKNSVPSSSGQSWTSRQSEQKGVETGRNTAAMVGVSRGRALTPEKETALSPMGTVERSTKVTERHSLVSGNSESGGQDYTTHRNLEQTRPEQSPRPSSILPRVEHIEKNIAPPKSGQSMKSQPTNNPQQWVPQQSLKERGEGTGYNTTQRLRRN